MTKYHGRTYCCKNKVIGVCQTLKNNLYMVGCIKPSGSCQRVRILPLSLNPDELQTRLDEFAKERGLMEVLS